jgi:hypothetical protein
MWRKIQALDLVTTYNTKAFFREYVQNFLALSFVNPERVIEYYTILNKK